jgi:hypothetical protein
MSANPEPRDAETPPSDIETKVIAAFLMPYYADLSKRRVEVQNHFRMLRISRAAGVVDRQALSSAGVTRDQLDLEIARFDDAVEHLGEGSAAAATQLRDIADAFQSLRFALQKIMSLMESVHHSG